MRVKVARLCSAMTEPRKIAGRSDRTKAPAKAATHKRAIGGRQFLGHQCPRTAAEDENPCIDRRGWLERGTRQPSRDSDLVARTPHHPVDGARPRQAALARDTPFDHEVCSNKGRPRIIKQQMQKVVRTTKRQVRDDTEWTGRQFQRYRVCLDHLDVLPTAPESMGVARVDLDGQDQSGHARQFSRDSAGARTDVNDDVVRSDTGLPDKLRREGAAS